MKNLSNGLIKRSRTFVFLFSITLLPFMQIGFNYYLSICALTFILLTFTLNGLTPKVEKFFRVRRLLVAFVPVVLLYLIPPIYLGATSRFDVLRGLRDAFFTLLLIFVLSKSKSVSENGAMLDRAKIINTFFYVITFLSLLTLIQFLGIRSGSSFFIPDYFFGRGKETLPGIYQFIYSNRLRPSGTFAEPSYFATVLLVLLHMLLRARNYIGEKKYRFFLFLLITDIVLIESALGYIGAVLVLWSASTQIQRAFIGLISLISLIFLFIVDKQTLLTQSLNANSADGRFIGALKLLPTYLTNFPFGLPPRQLFGSNSIEIDGIQLGVILNNGLLYWPFAYGFIGIGILLALIIIVRRSNFSFSLFIIIASQNGSFLDFDKQTLVLLVCLSTLMFQKFTSVRRSI